MKYITSFETLSGFQSAQLTLDTPNVSLIEATMEVNYLPYVAPIVQPHDYVEIGGIKWATMNVGANSITDTGLYFQWGDTQGYTVGQIGCEEGKKCFDDEFLDYIYYTDGDLTKYNYVDGLTTLQASDDAVTVAWGGNWRMPTKAEIEELITNTTYEWTTINGVNGGKFTAQNGNYVFFPACGYASYGSMENVGSECNYWSNSLDSVGKYNSYCLSDMRCGVNYRYNGFPVRGVLDE